MGDAENNIEIQAIDEVQSLVYETGFRKPLAQLKVEDKHVVSSVLVNYHCMTKVKASMDQYMEGLESLGLLSRIQADPSKWKNFFMDMGVTVDSSMLYTYVASTVEPIYSHVKEISGGSRLIFKHLQVYN